MFIALLETASGTSLQEFVGTAFGQAIAQIDGDFGKFGLAIFGILLSWHVLLGGAELATGDTNCRFLRGGFYVRFLTVFGVLLFFDTIFVGLSQAVATSATAEMVKAMAWPFKAAGDIPPQILDNLNHLADASTGTWTIMTAPFTTFVSIIVCCASALICIVAFYFAAVLMQVQGYVAIAYAALILILAPVMIPFGLHESTENIAWQYIKGWLIYGVLYLPLCVFAMSLASDLMMHAATSINAHGLTTGGMYALVAQMLSIVAAPLAVIGIIFVPNAVLNKVL